MATTTNNSNHELLRDVYASQLLVSLAKQAGFTAEPAVLNLATDEEYYTLSVMQEWLRVQHKILALITSVWSPDKIEFTYDLFDCRVWPAVDFKESKEEVEVWATPLEALEAGLKHAFHVLLYPK